MELPQSPQELTPTQLTQMLRNSGYLTVGQVRHIHLSSASDTSGIIGQTVRLQLEYDRPSDAPTSVIAKFPTSHEDRRAYFSALGMYTREVLFYQHLAASIPLNLPRCYYAAMEKASQRAFLLLEDLSPADTGNRVVGCSVEVAEQALAAIARLHTTWWNNPQLRQLDWLQAYNQPTFEAQFHRSWTAFLSGFAGQISDELGHLGNALSRNLTLLIRLWQPPLTLIHRDYNLDNLLFKRDNCGNERLYVIDWQLVRQGRAVFDVATFLCWNLLPDVRRRAELRLLRHYFDALVEAGVVDYSLDEYIADYRLAQLECLARILAILGSATVTEPPLLTLLQTLLERTLVALNDWDVYQLLA